MNTVEIIFVVDVIAAFYFWTTFCVVLLVVYIIFFSFSFKFFFLFGVHSFDTTHFVSHYIEPFLNSIFDLRSITFYDLFWKCFILIEFRVFSIAVTSCHIPLSVRLFQLWDSQLITLCFGWFYLLSSFFSASSIDQFTKIKWTKHICSYQMKNDLMTLIYTF